MKPFNLEAAKAGKPVITRDGREARIICFDRKDRDFPLVAVCDVEGGGGEAVYCCDKDGRPAFHKNPLLFMKPETVTRWVNVYPSATISHAYTSTEAADVGANSGRIACCKIEYEV